MTDQKLDIKSLLTDNSSIFRIKTTIDL